METVDVSGLRLKLKRAWQQTDLLKRDIDTFLQGDPYRPQVHFDGKTSRLTIYVQVHNAPDPMWGVRIGEIVHNFRSALDHLIWELAGHPSRIEAKTQFPIVEHEVGFTARGTKEFLKGVGESAIALIRSEQPCFKREDGTSEGHQSPLWHLKELSDADKHRTLQVTAATLSAHTFTFPPLKQQVTVLDVYKFQGGPIKQDTVLESSVLQGATDWPFTELNVQAALAPEVIFEEGIPVSGLWSVFGKLADIGNRTEAILRRITNKILKIEL